MLTQDAPDQIDDTHRTLIVLPRNHKPAKYHFEMTDRGRLVEVPDQLTVTKRLALLTAMTPGVWYRMKDLVEMGEKLEISKRSVIRYKQSFVERGSVVQNDNGYCVSPLGIAGTVTPNVLNN